MQNVSLQILCEGLSLPLTARHCIGGGWSEMQPQQCLQALMSSKLVWMQAMHKICLAHFERDQAAGGNLYSKFARCYLQLAGKEAGQQKAKQPLHAKGDPTDATANSRLSQHSSEDAQQNGPFDYKSPPHPKHPRLPTTQQAHQQEAVTSGSQSSPAPAWNVGPLTGEKDSAQQEPEAAVVEQEEQEKQARCGRALLERAMLGPPLPEGDGPICSSGMNAAVLSGYFMVVLW